MHNERWGSPIHSRRLSVTPVPVPGNGSRPLAQPAITQRERDVLLQLACGKTNKQIAQDLAISDFTVRDYVSSLLEKFGVPNRRALAVKHLESEPGLR
ncbi:MAG: response regulator transcription factor [Rubrivivax sp.]|nr:MAG: response regulator transcription factor [Rubrivivax sp.]